MRYNKDIHSDIIDDKKFRDEVITLLEELVNAEFEKSDDEIDFDFIDECTNAILSLNSADIQNIDCPDEVYKNISDCIKSADKKSPLRHARIILLVAVLLATSMTTYAATTGKNPVAQIMQSINVVEKVESTEKPVEETTTEKKEVVSKTEKAKEKTTQAKSEKKVTTVKENTTAPATTQAPQPTKKVVSVTQSINSNSTTQSTTYKVNMDTAQYMELCFDSGVKTTYKVGESINCVGMYVKIHYTDTYVTKMPVKYCKITGFDSSQAGTCQLTISYKNVSETFTVTIVE